MSSPALRLTSADFDACKNDRAEPPTAARRRVDLAQRATAWARVVAARLASLDVPAVVDSPARRTAATRRGSEAHWAVFSRATHDEPRGRAARRKGVAPFRKRPFLGLLVDATRVEVSCEVHASAAMDLEQLRRRLEEPRLAAELIAAIAALPDQFLLGTTTGARVPCAHVTRDSLRRAIDETRGAVGLWIGWSIPRDVALAHADILGDQLGDALVALVPVWALVTWSEPRQGVVPPVFEKGARVRVLHGAFAGKVGIVGELDGRGGARVMLGLLSTRMDLSSLGPVVEARPSLHSSHRRLAVKRSLS